MFFFFNILLMRAYPVRSGTLAHVRDTHTQTHTLSQQIKWTWQQRVHLQPNLHNYINVTVQAAALEKMYKNIVDLCNPTLAYNVFASIYIYPSILL